jgi:hypothetical protein
MICVLVKHILFFCSVVKHGRLKATSLAILPNLSVHSLNKAMANGNLLLTIICFISIFRFQPLRYIVEIQLCLVDVNCQIQLCDVSMAPATLQVVALRLIFVFWIIVSKLVLYVVIEI